jgi:hypothetical protein
MHRWSRRSLLVSLAALLGATGPIASAQSAAGWTADFTVRLESAGQRPVGASADKAAVSGTFEWRSTQEARGTLAYTQRLRGAVAINQPDRNNEQRYESWLARAQRVPVQLTLHNVRSEQSSGRVVAVDGEGAAAVNRANAGKIGKVEHIRARTEVKVDGADAARMGGAYLQIDRVANQVRFEVPTIEINPARITVLEQRVARLGAPAPAGEWDRNETFTPGSGQDLRTPLRLPYPTEFVFDVPAATLADAREITLTQEFKAGQVDYEVPASRGTVTLVLRRAEAAAGGSTPAAGATGAGAAAAAAAVATTPATTATATKTATAAPAPNADNRKSDAPPPTQPATQPAAPTLQDAAKAVDKLRNLFGR